MFEIFTQLDSVVVIWNKSRPEGQTHQCHLPTQPITLMYSLAEMHVVLYNCVPPRDCFQALALRLYHALSARLRFH